MNSLFFQLHEVEREALAQLCGFEDCAGFRNMLRDMPETEGNLGKKAIAVLKFRIQYVKSLNKKSK